MPARQGLPEQDADRPDVGGRGGGKRPRTRSGGPTAGAAAAWGTVPGWPPPGKVLVGARRPAPWQPPNPLEWLGFSPHPAHMAERDADIEFDFFDEPETREA